MTNTGLGKGIEEALKGILEEPQQGETTAYDDPETLEAIRRIYKYLGPHIVKLEWWGEYCTEPEKLSKVLQLYQENSELMNYPSIIDLGSERGVVHNKHYWPYHVLGSIKRQTEKWNSLSHAEQKKVIENCRQQELIYMYGCNEHPTACHPIIPPEKYAAFEIRLKEWDGTHSQLLKIKQELGIDDPSKYRYSGTWDSPQEKEGEAAI
jgi:hypothetical protein